MVKLLGVVLCAGRSRRMGRHKALLRREGKTFLEGALHALSCCESLVAVVSAREVEAAVPEGVASVFNPDPDVGGMLRSLALAFRAHPTSWALVLPVDCPAVAPSTSALLAGVRNGTPNLRAVTPTFGGVAGHPVLLGSELIARVVEADAGGEETHLGRLLEEGPTHQLPVADGAVLENINTPGDLEGFRQEEEVPS